MKELSWEIEMFFILTGWWLQGCTFVEKVNHMTITVCKLYFSKGD